ncbi:MAG: transketolase [Deltaproteobacteria bacterium]|nr:transketolase [Deltaproteobacteria bacterium]MBW2307223.1 transketolase [Deltaproteobacteria bacterium]
MNSEKVLQWKRDCIEARELVIRGGHKSGAGHAGGSLSAIEIFRGCLAAMKFDPQKPESEDSDWLVLSKGHACLGWYAVLAQQGYITVDELLTFERLDSRLQGHIDRSHFYPYARISTGSLGQGLSAGIGMRLSMMRKNRPGRVVVILGDGECQEGMVLEAAMFAGFHKLRGLVAVIDDNKLQLVGKTDDVLSIKPTRKVWESFGWETMEIDGHDIQQVVSALETGLENREKPVLIVANTVKGKGISFMEDNFLWHHRAPNDQEKEQALEELKQARLELMKGAE